jgi:hypothetical protein
MISERRGAIKTEGKRLLGIPRRRWEDDMKMNLRERGIDSSGLG